VASLVKSPIFSGGRSERTGLPELRRHKAVDDPLTWRRRLPAPR
jgi:hypothetical protein